MPFVFEYRRRYSDMKVEIVTEGRLIDIITDGFDAGVRLAEAVPQDMIAVPLGSHARHVVVGTPSYFAKRPRPIAPTDLMDHECIRARYSSGALYRWEFERHGEAMKIDVPGSLTLDEPEMIAQASRAGLGLAYVGEWMVADDITSGRLVEVLASGRLRIPDIVSTIQDAATWPQACAPSSIWPRRWSIGIARRRLDGYRTGGPIAPQAQQPTALTR
jgi:DNA-binding transcriptional LysR family regulator